MRPAYVATTRHDDGATARSHSNFKQRKDRRPHSRGAMRPSFASTSPSLSREGAGKAGCRSHPRSCAQKAHEWTTGSTGSLRLSPREWFTAYFGLSPVTGLFATVAFADWRSIPNPVGPDGSPQDLTPASGRQDHTISPSATVHAKNLAGPRAVRRVLARTVCSVVRPRAVRSLTGNPALRSRCAPDAVASIASHRAFVTSRDPPLIRVGRGELVMVICPTC
jgi:hypothetical protein